MKTVGAKIPARAGADSSSDSVIGKKAGASRPYLKPFRLAIKALGVEGSVPEKFEVTREQLRACVSILLRGVEFDEEWYLERYPDIADAVARGDIAGAKQHFVEHGYWEGRHPARVVVDEEWYAIRYADVAEGLELGEIPSCQEHFDNHGRDEGRLPYDG